MFPSAGKPCDTHGWEPPRGSASTGLGGSRHWPQASAPGIGRASETCRQSFQEHRSPHSKSWRCPLNLQRGAALQTHPGNSQEPAVTVPRPQPTRPAAGHLLHGDESPHWRLSVIPGNPPNGPVRRLTIRTFQSSNCRVQKG